MEQGTCERCGSPFDKTRKAKRFCTERCRKRAERGRRDKPVFVNRTRDTRASFDTARYLGGRIADQDLGAYYAALRADPCAYCNEPSAELDHIEPKANGGYNFWDNRAAICSRCNARKGKRSILNAMLALPVLQRRADLADDLQRLGQW